jgi:predicted GIY-YIG superfamily endonuclease
MTAWLYILRLQSDSLYIGATKDLKKRYALHRDGSAGRTTSLDPPVSIVYSEDTILFHRHGAAKLKSNVGQGLKKKLW